MQYEYILTVHDYDEAITTETFEADPKFITTESTENGEKIVVTNDDPDDIKLEVFVPRGTPYTLRKED